MFILQPYSEYVCSLHSAVQVSISANCNAKGYTPTVYLAFSSEQQQQLPPGYYIPVLEPCMPPVVTVWHRIHGETHVGCGPRQNANNLQLCELNPDETLANMAPPRKHTQLSASLLC